MAIDTTVQPWIVKMLTPPDGRVLGEAINRFAEGAATGYLSAKRNSRQEIIEAGGIPEPEGRLERVVRLANPQAVATLDQVLSKDLHTIGQETGELKNAQEIFSWVAKNAALSASPVGRNILSTISENGRRMAAVEADSAAHIAAVELAKKRAQLMVKYNLPPDATKEQWATISALENEQEFTERAARVLGKDVSGLITPQDFDPNGNWLPGAQQRILKSSPRSQTLQSREELASRPLSQIGKEEFDLQKAIESGDTEGAQRIRNAIAAKRESSESAPIIERKLRLYRDALAKGDKTAIQAYENELKLNALPPQSKALYEAEIQALDRDLKMATNPQGYLDRRMEIVRKYFNQPASASAPSGKVFRPDFKTGRLVPVQ